MNSKQKGPVVAAGDPRFLNESRNFERDIERERDQSTKFAWRVATAAVVLAAVAVMALAVLVSRFQPFAFLVTVDRATGETSVVKTLDRDTVQYDEMHDKHNINRFIMSRERYLFQLLQYDYDTTLNLSTDEVGSAYAKLFEGDKALDKVLGAGTEYRITILSTRLPTDQPGKAIVSFERVIRRANTRDAEAPARYVATLSYAYKPSLLAKEAVWVANPTGFKVTAYRADPEQVGAAK